MWICYKLEIFVDINFCGCFISCVLLYLPKYVAIAMETTRFPSVIRGHHTRTAMHMGTYTRPDFTVWMTYTQPDFTVWKGKQQYIRPFCCFHNGWWQNCGPHAAMDFSCMYVATFCSIMGQLGVKLQEIGSLQVIFRKANLKCHVTWYSMVKRNYLIFVACDVPMKSTKICTPRKLLPLRYV